MPNPFRPGSAQWKMYEALPPRERARLDAEAARRKDNPFAPGSWAARAYSAAPVDYQRRAREGLDAERARAAAAKARAANPRLHPEIRRYLDEKAARERSAATMDWMLQEQWVQDRLIRPLQGPGLRPTYDTLAAAQFDPRGPRLADYRLRRPDLWFVAGLEGDGAKKRNYVPPPKGHNTRYDARRHADWSAALARRLGPKRAKELLDAYERNRPGPDAETAMDVLNNWNGRVMASILPRMDSYEIAEQLGRAGWLQDRPIGQEWSD